MKANAYGHGAVAVAQALANDVDAFGVACIEEALELRHAGITCPILLLGGFFSVDELAIISEQAFWCTVHSAEQLQALDASPLTKPVNILLKMDSGMHGLGVTGSKFKRYYQRLKHLTWVNDIVLMTHFSSADELYKPESALQWAYFQKHNQDIDADISLTNSAATLAKDYRPHRYSATLATARSHALRRNTLYY